MRNAWGEHTPTRIIPGPGFRIVVAYFAFTAGDGAGTIHLDCRRDTTLAPLLRGATTRAHHVTAGTPQGWHALRSTHVMIALSF